MKRFLFTLPLACALFACSKAPEAASTPPPVDHVAAGLQVYTANCAVCHQVDGYGVSGIQPALVDNEIVTGDADRLIQIVLKGPAAVLPKDRPRYSNVMPPFNRLTDDQIADVLTYVRHDFDHGAPAIEAAQVKTTRAQAGL